MKANEIEDGTVLMIGDLVIGCIETDTVGEATYKIPCKVTDINHYGDVSCEALKPFPDELDWQDGDDFSWIEPIPLTPEILEKNGFKIDKDETYWKRYFFAANLDKIPQTVVEFSFYDDSVPADTLLKCWTRPESCDGENSVHICDLRYVHQLQHALRLCGIDKEIEL